MTDTGWLMLIALMTGITTIIQCVEMWLLLRSSRQTNAYLANPAPLISGFLRELAEDKEFAQEFAGFVAWMGQTGLSGVKTAMQDAGIKPPKIKSFGDLLGFMVQMPQIQAAIEKKAKAAIEGAAGEAVEKTAEAWL